MNKQISVMTASNQMQHQETDLDFLSTMEVTMTGFQDVASTFDATWKSLKLETTMLRKFAVENGERVV
jgi:hypothetical protein